MSCLPVHGRVVCDRCYKTNPLQFDETIASEGDWRITYNPLAWGSTEPEIIVLGFSKGPTQKGALVASPHDDIAYMKGRGNVGKILAHVGLLPKNPPEGLKCHVNGLISNRSGRFHFGSLVRCTVERYDHKESDWTGTGGGMLDKFVATPFGARVAQNCAERFLVHLPDKTKLIVMFGLGKKLNYIKESFELFKRIRPGAWVVVNPVAYSDGAVMVVHVEHFQSQGALIPNWLGENQHERSTFGVFAREAVQQVIGAQLVLPDEAR